jgi:hypothetical protein
MDFSIQWNQVNKWAIACAHAVKTHLECPGFGDRTETFPFPNASEPENARRIGLLLTPASSTSSGMAPVEKLDQ